MKNSLIAPGILSDIRDRIYAHQQRFGGKPARFPVTPEEYSALLESEFWKPVYQIPWTDDTQAHLGYPNTLFMNVPVYPEETQ